MNKNDYLANKNDNVLINKFSDISNISRNKWTSLFLQLEERLAHEEKDDTDLESTIVCNNNDSFGLNPATCDLESKNDSTFKSVGKHLLEVAEELSVIFEDNTNHFEITSSCCEYFSEDDLSLASNSFLSLLDLMYVPLAHPFQVSLVLP